MNDTMFDLDSNQRDLLWNKLIQQIEFYYSNTSSLKVNPILSVDKIKDYISQHSFNQNVEPEKAIEHVIEGLSTYAVQTPHPMYYGLYNPRTTFPSIIADTIAATTNPQLAAWSHSPYANEVENYLIHEFGKKFGFDEGTIDGTFASGGAEANQTAVLVALNQKFPTFKENGTQNIRPVFYASSESHHSFFKAAQTSGIGNKALRMISGDEMFRMSVEKLEKQIITDLSDGFQPFMLVGTAGTTGAGIVDPLPELEKMARKYGLWFHVDAAYGGAAILSPNLKQSLAGIELADSITFDAHKWLSVPMGGSLFITSHKQALGQTFGISTNYMPTDAGGLPVTDPYSHSIQWSRRFIGLKLYMSLLFFGWEGYAKVIQHQTDIGMLLKLQLIKTGWTVLNQSPFPVLCFTDERFMKDESFSKQITSRVVESGKAWISVYKLGEINTIRACITNYNTNEENIRSLVENLNESREHFIHKNSQL